ncbi:MAG: proline/glycine betaine ABC transporter permease [Gammaproteobacteria bacterium]|nr:proline/glycine betaine ABC transporter permease [Gammaproteobacteria bacterium]
MDFRIPIGDWVEAAVEWLLVNLQPFFDGVTLVIGWLVDNLEGGLLAIPPWAFILIIAVLGLWCVGWRFTLFAIASLLLVIGMNLWPETISTLALVIASTIVALVIGMPLGVVAAKSDLALAVIRPILDLMQTMPPFVYLIPAAMFFGLGKVPGTIATIIFAMPPAVRLTNLGIRQVAEEMVEAGLSFGCTRRQLLFKVQLPIAMPSIMAGVNQVIMLSLSMVVIASMIGAGGLGNEVLRGIQRLDIGLGFEGGLGVVILAMVLDRISQSVGTRRNKPSALDRLKDAWRWLTRAGHAEESHTPARR